MQLTNVLLATLFTSVLATPAADAAALAARQDPLPEASCRCCDLSRPGWTYTVPDPVEGCPICPAVECPIEEETQEWCCCCSTDEVKCSAIPKGAGCNCPKIACLVSWADPNA
ncbi:hypothetical protein CSOJ01_00683 [Colletotrichum sojae]|uniref:Uncharacterized protein n=1 Tax=Colletotrichum sojae TaxID=2175907 RepID=A0A8H6N4T8_9PEZI|nr:hypothetical protein CSOJ01_00683 [Colletotrichum sojae]